MKNDISRNTFDPRKHFSRVLMQQGRVQLDADWNEQASIFMHYLRTLATDLIGPHGGPERACGFEIIDATRAQGIGELKAKTAEQIKKAGFFIGLGRYYVDGLLCENESYSAYREQADYPLLGDDEQQLKDGRYLAYLDVWERIITAAEDETIREVALGGPDTATRARIVWQVKLLAVAATDMCGAGADKLAKDIARELPQLRARLKPEASSDDPCILSPDSRYRGPENQLYRVEIHHVSDKKVTFKWSRENGSVVFPVTAPPKIDGSEAILNLAHFGRDSHLGLADGDWVELVDDSSVLHERADPLLRVVSLDREEGTVTLKGTVKDPQIPRTHALLRRWDHRGKDEEFDGLEVAPSDDAEKGWIPLEGGVEIQFAKGGAFRTGDYWLIPARTTGEIEWPKGQALPPRGIVHHYAPLGIVSVTGGDATLDHDCRCKFERMQLTSGITLFDLGVSPGRSE